MKPIPFDRFIASEAARREAWNRAFAGVMARDDAAPNAGHAAIARLVAKGKAACVITQNVDNLHQASGVPPEKVIEVHGNATYAACLECGVRHELADLRRNFLESDEIPSCRDCGGIVKTATISFGQQLAPGVMEQAERQALACDLFLVLGSSLVVYPAAMLPMAAKRNGARLAIVNRDPTDQDEYADLVLHDELGPTLSEAVP
jgi:NAD-dependent deacetylase